MRNQDLPCNERKLTERKNPANTLVLELTVNRQIKIWYTPAKM